MSLAHSAEQMVGEAGGVVEACGSLGSLNLAIAGKWGPGCASGNECLLSRVPSQGLKLRAPSARASLPCSVFPGTCTVVLTPSTSPSAKNQLLGPVMELPVQVMVSVAEKSAVYGASKVCRCFLGNISSTLA